MRILMTPEANTAETDGSITRTLSIAREALKRGHEVAFCAGTDINFRRIDNAKYYESQIPSPLGLPKWMGKLVYKLYKHSGLQKVEKVSDYEQIFHVIGLVSKRFFSEDVDRVRSVIQDFKPDIIFTEHRLSPIVAAKKEHIPIATTYSVPIHESLKSKHYGQHSQPVKRIVKELGLPSIESFLDLYHWVDLKIVPSSMELEPMNADRLCYVGLLVDPQNVTKSQSNHKKNILVYLGNSGLSGQVLVKLFTKALMNSEYHVYIASKEIKPCVHQNIVVDHRFDFSKLFPETLVFFSHGGQNSMMESFINGVPLAVFPGGVAERQFNADTVVQLQAGLRLTLDDFTQDGIKKVVAQFAANESYRKNAEEIGEKIIKLGGPSKVIDLFEAFMK